MLREEERKKINPVLSVVVAWVSCDPPVAARQATSPSDLPRNALWVPSLVHYEQKYRNFISLFAVVCS